MGGNREVSVDDVDEAIQTIVERVGAKSKGEEQDKFRRLSETATKLQTKVKIDPQVMSFSFPLIKLSPLCPPSKP